MQTRLSKLISSCPDETFYIPIIISYIDFLILFPTINIHHHFWTLYIALAWPALVVLLQSLMNLLDLLSRIQLGEQKLPTIFVFLCQCTTLTLIHLPMILMVKSKIKP